LSDTSVAHRPGLHGGADPIEFVFACGGRLDEERLEAIVRSAWEWRQALPDGYGAGA